MPEKIPANLFNTPIGSLKNKYAGTTGNLLINKTAGNGNRVVKTRMNIIEATTNLVKYTLTEQAP